jgi:hypothetical protein
VKVLLFPFSKRTPVLIPTSNFDHVWITFILSATSGLPKLLIEHSCLLYMLNFEPPNAG